MSESELKPEGTATEPQVETVEAVETAPEVAIEKQAVRIWAEKAGHLPESFPGDRMRPSYFNRTAWLARAVCLRLKLTLDDPIDERTYLDTVAELSAAETR